MTLNIFRLHCGYLCSYIDKYVAVMCWFICHRSSEWPELCNKFLGSDYKEYQYHYIWSGSSWSLLVCNYKKLFKLLSGFFLDKTSKFLAMIVNKFASRLEYFIHILISPLPLMGRKMFAFDCWYSVFCCLIKRTALSTYVVLVWQVNCIDGPF